MNKLLALSAVVEAATGAALMTVPSVVGRMLLGEALHGDAATVGRIAGAGLFSLGIACWPSKEPRAAALCAMRFYNFVVGLYLAYLGIQGPHSGPLLWPAAIAHLILAVLMAIRI